MACLARRAHTVCQTSKTRELSARVLHRKRSAIFGATWATCATKSNLPLRPDHAVHRVIRRKHHVRLPIHHERRLEVPGNGIGNIGLEPEDEGCKPEDKIDGFEDEVEGDGGPGAGSGAGLADAEDANPYDEGVNCEMELSG